MSNRQLRVLHVLPTRAKEYGGPVAVAEALVAGIRQLGAVGEIYPALPDEGRCGANSLWAAVKRCDVVHTHGLWNLPASLAAVYARLFKKHLVITPHGMLDRWALRNSRLKKLIYGAVLERRNIRLASAIHFLNHEELEESRDYGVPLTPFVLPNGVFVRNFGGLPPRQELRAEYPELSGKTVVLFLGRLHPKKGFDLLLPAFNEARQFVPNLHLLVAGPDENGYLSRLRIEISRLGLEAHVTFMGMVQGRRKLQAFSAGDVFVLPSHQEGDSVALKEALASGMPAIITPACHFPELALFGAGIEIEPRVHALATALVELGGDLGRASGMGVRARSLVSESYDWSRIASRLLEVYHILITGGVPSVEITDAVSVVVGQPTKGEFDA